MKSKRGPAKGEVHGAGATGTLWSRVGFTCLALLSCAAPTPTAKASKLIANPRSVVHAARQSASVASVAVAGREEEIEHPASGDFHPEQIQRGVREKFKDIRACYEPALIQNPTAFGAISVHLVIDQNGDVSEVWPTLTGNLPLEMNACVERVFRGLKFDARTGGPVTLDYPVVFVPGGERP